MMEDEMRTDHQHKKMADDLFLVNYFIKDITAKYRFIKMKQTKNEIEIDEISSLPHIQYAYGGC